MLMDVVCLSLMCVCLFCWQRDPLIHHDPLEENRRWAWNPPRPKFLTSIFSWVCRVCPPVVRCCNYCEFFLITRAESIYNRSLFNYEGTTLCHSGFSSLMQFPTAEPRYFKAGLLDNLVLLSEWEGKLAKQTHSFIFIKENQAINNTPTFGGAFEAAGLECCVWSLFKFW